MTPFEGKVVFFRVPARLDQSLFLIKHVTCRRGRSRYGKLKLVRTWNSSGFEVHICSKRDFPAGFPA